ncbi:MAG: YgeY family selenium metabolism-linked hydrolase [Candidatus Eisenbacteria bacterium]|nr:YgeY family selenium metabolism-linked hydrolase [Candidatus Eisenbacteria bacterium]
MSDARERAILEAAREEQDAAVELLRELVRTPSPSGDEGRIVALIRERMQALAFDEVRIDAFGNVLGRVGDGRRTLAFDAHVDAVGVGDSQAWAVDPYGGELRDGIVYGRGAADQKGGMAALVHAGALMRRLDLLRDTTVWIVGSVLEEDCDGLCWHYILSEGVLQPEAVVLTEPTDLQLYRGHRGRMEIEATARGRAAHGSAPERGRNAIYRMAPVIEGIRRLADRLGDDPFLGRGSVTISQVRSTAPSLCAVADSCTIHLDRRLTAGEDDARALDQVRCIAADAGLGGDDVTIQVPEFRRPSHTGVVYPMRQYYPAWAMPEDDPLVRLGLRAREAVAGKPGRAGRWGFSTNGVATRGLHGVPTIGFGPGNEIHAHAPTDQCPAEHIGIAVAFYAALAARFAGEMPPAGGDAE